MATGRPGRIAADIFSALASAAYWFGVLALLEAATLVDYATGAEPDEAWMVGKIVVLLALAPLVYALLIRTIVPAGSARRWFSLIAFAVVAGLYWFATLAIFYGLTAGDRRDGPVSPSVTERIEVLLVVLAAVAIFTLLLRGFRAIMGGRTGGPADA